MSFLHSCDLKQGLPPFSSIEIVSILREQVKLRRGPNKSLASLTPAMGSTSSWKQLAQKCIDIRDESIPKQWLLDSKSLPAQSRLNVLDIPSESSLLSAEELQMTEQNAAGLLDAYRSGKWSVQDVITAFLKRATVMQQLVSLIRLCTKLSQGHTKGWFAKL